MTPAEQQAIRTDAEKRLKELRARAARLIPDSDDSFVLSELHSVIGQIRQAEEALR